MNSTTAIRIAAALGFLGVILGAFGAHSLRPLLGHNGTTAIWEKAVLYHLIHAVMLYVIAQKQPLAKCPFSFFLAGILIFSGSLYVLAVTDILWLGAITPIGGICFLIGWGTLICGAGKSN